MSIDVGGNIVTTTTINNASFSNNIVTDNLIVYLDASNLSSYSGSGSVWTDLTGNANNGTLINGPSYSGGGIVLDGSSQYITIPYNQVNFNTSTLIYVAKLDASPNSRNTIFSQYYGGNGAQMEWGSGGSLRSNYRQNAASTPENDAPNGTGISTNTIYHIAVTYNTGGVIRHYKNGVLLGSNTNSSQTNVNGGDLINVGRNSSAGLYFKGLVYKVMIYNRVLHSAEIINNYYSVKTRFGI